MFGRNTIFLKMLKDTLILQLLEKQ
jgi:hypothetical protein